MTVPTCACVRTVAVAVVAAAVAAVAAIAAAATAGARLVVATPAGARAGLARPVIPSSPPSCARPAEGRAGTQ